jgi:hypothetical protein
MRRPFKAGSWLKIRGVKTDGPSVGGQPAGVHPAPDLLGVAVNHNTAAAPKISPKPISFFIGSTPAQFHRSQKLAHVAPIEKPNWMRLST